MDLSGYLTTVVVTINSLFLIYFFGYNLSSTILIVLSFPDIRRNFRRYLIGEYEPMTKGENVPPVSLLVPAYNEELTIVDTVESLQNLDYVEYEIVVINDGSKDGTLNQLISHFRLRKAEPTYENRIDTAPIVGVYRSFDFPNLTVVDKENGGKADALNCGINISKYPLFVAIDADSLLERKSILHLVKPCIEDSSVIAVGGIVRIANGSQITDSQLTKARLPRNPVVVHQIIEYFRAFLASRAGWSKLNSLLIISGAFGLFQKKWVINAGGYRRGTVGEDMELILRLHKTARDKKTKYRIAFVSNPVCWTQAPEQMRDLKKQRVRWHHGLMDSLTLHRDMLFDRKYGLAGISRPSLLLAVRISRADD